MLNTGQAMFETTVFNREFFMVYSEAVKNGSIHVTDMCALIFNIVSPKVCLAPLKAGFDTTAGHPYAEATAMMVATGAIRADCSLAVGGATKHEDGGDNEQNDGATDRPGDKNRRRRARHALSRRHNS